jgi:hypothetical protein
MNLNFKALVGALAVLSLASCSKNDVFDAQQAAANEIAQKKTTFENNFVAKYGQVAPTQSWDFSTNQQRLGTRGFNEVKTTPVKLIFSKTYFENASALRGRSHFFCRMRIKNGIKTCTFF